MTEKRDVQSRFCGNSRQRSVLAEGLSWLSGLSVLGAGMAFAQTPGASEVPSAQDLLSPIAQDAAVGDETLESEPSVLELPAQPVLSPADAATPETIPPDFTTTDSSTAPSPLVAPDLSERATSAFSNGSGQTPVHQDAGGSAYIDPTPYDLGATKLAPPNVVVSERTTGCQITLQPGQTSPGAVCTPESVATSGTGSYSPSSYGSGELSVYNLPTAETVTSARSFYNLTVRPPARLSNGNAKMLFPLSIPAIVTSVFGWRMHPVTGDMRFHSGTDIGAPQGTPVVAAYSGKVDIADFVGGYGLTVVLAHQNGQEQTLYAHLSEVFVKPGDEVKQGEVIARVGSTGLSTGPHLHFEFRQLTAEGWVVLDAGSVLETSLADLVQVLAGGGNKPLQLPAVFASSGKSLKIKTTPTAQSLPTAAPTAPAVAPVAADRPSGN